MTKTIADLERENAELRARVELQDKLLARLLAEPPKVEVRVVEKVVSGVCLLPHFPCALPHYPPATIAPWPQPGWSYPNWPYGTTICNVDADDVRPVNTYDFRGWHPNTAGCAPNPYLQQLTIASNEQWSGSGTCLPFNPNGALS